MSEVNEISSIGSLTGRTVISLSSGNKLGRVTDAQIDPLNGQLLGLTLDEAKGGTMFLLPLDAIYSFGRDAVMAESDGSIRTVDDSVQSGRYAKELFGTTVIMESGDVLGEIADVLITLKAPPVVIYEVRKSMLDRLLGRNFYIPASVGHALSDDAARLVVSDATAQIASADMTAFVGPVIDVRGTPSEPVDSTAYEAQPAGRKRDSDVARPNSVNDQTLPMRTDEDDTILRRPVTKG